MLPYLHTARTASHPMAAPRYSCPNRNAVLLPRVAGQASCSCSVFYFQQKTVQDNPDLSTSKVTRVVTSKSYTQGSKREGREGWTNITTWVTYGFTTLHHTSLKYGSFFNLFYYEPWNSFVLLGRESPLPFQYTAVNYINAQLIIEINHQAVLSDEHHDIHEHTLTPGSCFGRLRKWLLPGWAKLSGWVAYVSRWPWSLCVLHSLDFKHMKYLSSPKNCIISYSISFQTKPHYKESAATSSSTEHAALLLHLSYTHIWKQILEYKAVVWLLTQHGTQWFAKLDDLIELDQPEHWKGSTSIQDYPAYLAISAIFSDCTVFPSDRNVTSLCWIWVICGQISSHFGPRSAEGTCHLCTGVLRSCLNHNLVSLHS